MAADDDRRSDRSRSPAFVDDDGDAGSAGTGGTSAAEPAAEACELAARARSDSGADSASSAGSTITSADRRVDTPAGTEAPCVSGGSADGASTPRGRAPSTIREEIEKLKGEQKALRAEAKKRARDVRNAERRSKRLKGKVSGLTDKDLDEILRIRADAKAAAAQRAPARSRRMQPVEVMHAAAGSQTVESMQSC